jgi:ribonuclease HI/transposase InsO family protein
VLLVDFLRANADIFAWNPSDMPGIPREVAKHSLDILPHSRAVQQRLRRFDEERRRAIGVELRKLLKAGFIKEVFHPTWLANHVLVKKKNGKWRMCIDYTSLNKACPKVPFPLPRIDQIVDSTAGCELLCFLDAYSGYHQIKMKESDQLATSFITPFGLYCYVTMLLGLRNAGATYQRCMQHVFGDHIGRTIKAYVDDIVVKTRKADDLVDDLRIAFGCLRANRVKLNPEKCVFGVPRGMLLGYIVSQRGIEANPEKVAALERMSPIRDLKGVQKVLGCLAALSRFISRLGEKGLPLYRLLKKHERFSWTTEAQEALDKLKATLAHAPILTSPRDGEPLYLYVVATTQVVSAVIVVERTKEGHALPVRRPVYYISEVLSETKVRYPQVQKLLYAVVLERRKLRHYFEAHPVTVFSSFLLGEISRNPDAAGRIAKWSVELMGETLAYAPRKAIKSQILADFITEWTDTQLLPPQIQAECWTLYFDGSVMKTGAGTGLLFISPLGEHMRYAVRLHFPASNNMAEYEALLCGLRITIETGIKRLDVRGDSQLVIDQVMKNASCHDDKMEAYCKAVRALEDKFYGIELNHVPRRCNEEADELTKIESGRITVPPNVFARDIAQPSVNLEPNPSSREEPSGAPSSPIGAEPMDEDPSNEAYVLSLLKGYGADEAEAMDTEPTPNKGDWREKYIAWMDRGELPSDRSEARRIARMAKSFALIDGELYKRAASGVPHRCVPIPQGRQLLQDIHAGICGHHAAPRTLVGNAFRQGFYWPTAVADASEIVRTFEWCQFYARKSNLPAHVLQIIPGLDIVGPLQKAPGGYTHLLVAIDKFSKWIEVRPITNLRAKQAVTFFTDIIYRFGVPNSIIIDNGSQFTGRKFLEFCDKFHIRVDWAAVAHPQTNGQVERANGMILQGLKPRIFDQLNKSGRKWLQELPAVVWSLRTTPSRATGFTPFFLVYGAEAILPTDLEYGSPRARGYDEDANRRAREDSLDQLDEARTVALMHSARYQQALRRYQARKVRQRDFSEGDLVLRLHQDNRGRHKLSPPWEGPYVVVKVLKPGTYKLANEDEEELTNAWNIQQLRPFYP